MFVGFYDTGTPAAYRGNPGTIGIQTGLTPAVTNALGGGIAELAIRITVDDGDTSVGNFDYFRNDLIVNGQNVQDFSEVMAVETSSTGTVLGPASAGFTNNDLDTGFFYETDSTILTAIYNQIIATQQIIVQVQDVDPYDNFYDFTQGLDSSLINVGTGPVVTPSGPAIPEPSTIGLLGFGAILGLVAYRRRKQKAAK